MAEGGSIHDPVVGAVKLFPHYERNVDEAGEKENAQTKISKKGDIQAKKCDEKDLVITEKGLAAFVSGLAEEEPGIMVAGRREETVDVEHKRENGNVENISLKSEDMFETEKGLDEFAGEFVDEAIFNIMETIETENTEERERQIGISIKDSDYFAERLYSASSIDSVRAIRLEIEEEKERQLRLRVAAFQECQFGWLFGGWPKYVRGPTYAEYINSTGYEVYDYEEEEDDDERMCRRKPKKMRGVRKLLSRIFRRRRQFSEI
ncbi:hypothetical protein ScPMuIL_015669 [Solemya velum]